jgi:hypothetical protein
VWFGIIIKTHHTNVLSASYHRKRGSDIAGKRKRRRVGYSGRVK